MTDTASRGHPGTDQGRLDEAKEQVQEKAQEVGGQARDKARGMVDERSTEFGEKVGQQAQDVRSIAEQLRQQGKEGPAKMAEQAADRAERLGSYLRDSDGQSILDDVERMARNNPWAVVVGGIAIGFAASRFLKASSRERYRSSGGGSSRGLTQLPRTVGASGAGPYGGGSSGAGAGAYSTPSRADEAAVPPPAGSTPLATPATSGGTAPTPEGPGGLGDPATPSRDPVRSR
ncbi:hypothetical protein [Capillimicrobium parvum]|uniref:Uncharacterized protein n=1 Tax=Capillimicrobium parvum TaxID=2884022 RepID=A0A9E7C158_9ACTN|nr:hypothetical protein [Capillimicrobium parvum]UGS37081.1 hypothetical protein DSM104329_03494 [Capillimicrobium parvum]